VIVRASGLAIALGETVQDSHNTLSRQTEIHLYRQALVRKFVDDVQRSESSAAE
jgi:hypothetical protein